jgi:hypothetical protein
MLFQNSCLITSLQNYSFWTSSVHTYFTYKIKYAHRHYEFKVIKYLNLIFYTLFLCLVFLFTHGTCHVYLPSCFTDIIAPFYWRWKIKSFTGTVYLPSLLLWHNCCWWLWLHTHTHTHTHSLYSKCLWLVKSVVLLVSTLQLLFHLVSAIPRDKLPASLCCETSYRGHLESAWLNAPTFFIFILLS